LLPYPADDPVNHPSNVGMQLDKGCVLFSGASPRSVAEYHLQCDPCPCDRREQPVPLTVYRRAQLPLDPVPLHGIERSIVDRHADDK